MILDFGLSSLILKSTVASQFDCEEYSLLV